MTKDNWAGGVQIDLDRRLDLDPQDVLAHIRADKPYPHAYVQVQPAQDAFEFVLASAGAVRPKRDAVDERVTETVRTGKITAKPNADDLAAKLRDVGYADNVIKTIIEMTNQGIISNIEQVGGYPEYQGEPYADADGDGMPDDWETKYGLNPFHSLDAAGDLNGDGYTNIEEFLNGRDPRAEAKAWTAPPGYVDVWQGRILD